MTTTTCDMCGKTVGDFRCRIVVSSEVGEGYQRDLCSPKCMRDWLDPNLRTMITDFQPATEIVLSDKETP